jgi:hypothetical protein
MTTPTGPRVAELHAALAAQRVADYMTHNRKPYPAGMGTFYELGKRRACGEAFSRTPLPVSSLVIVGGVATCTLAAGHVFEAGETAVIAGATVTGGSVNGAQEITSAAGNAFTFATALGDQAATGTITAGRTAPLALKWPEVQALSLASEASKAAMVGTEIEAGGATWANVSQVRAYCSGVLEVHDALRATAKGTHPLSSGML